MKTRYRSAKPSGDSNLASRSGRRIVCISVLTCILTGCSTSPKRAEVTEDALSGSYPRVPAQNSLVPANPCDAAKPGVAASVADKTPNISSQQLRNETNTSLFILPPPLLQLPQQSVARQEVEQSSASPVLVRKMLAGEALSLTEIQELARSNISDGTIVKYLRSTGAVYLLNIEQIDQLRGNSVSDSVMDYLLSTAAYRTSPLYYPIYLPVYSSRLYPPRWRDHHDFEFHHDFHHDVHH